MTTPAQDAPFCFPPLHLRFRRMALICVALATVMFGISGFFGHIVFGVFFLLGLGMGLANAAVVRRSAEAITATDHPLKKKMALNSAVRLVAITLVALAIGIFFRPNGLGVFFGLAVFQILLVLDTALPVLKGIKAQ